MCGIFGIISETKVNKKDLLVLANHARQRGKDSSGFIEYDGINYTLSRFDFDLKKSINKIKKNNKIFIGHSRLVTNSMLDNQPIFKNNICIFHNGIITNFNELYHKFNIKQKYKIDTEIILDLFNFFFKKYGNVFSAINSILLNIFGTASCVIHMVTEGKIILFTNNGSLYYGKKYNDIYISSESFPLTKLKCNSIEQVNRSIVLNVPKVETSVIINENRIERKNNVPEILKLSKKYILPKYELNLKKRCSKCILPDNFPFIEFDEFGVCNYCKNYKKKYSNFDKDSKKIEIENIINKYKFNKKINTNCLLPLSGGRDSCFGLHLLSKELGIKPITFTYDWGLVTDLARRNISRMCSILNVENIIIADDIQKKRSYIKKNVLAWLKKPHLGMVNLFSAGDKHFYRHLDKVKKQNQIDLNLWAYNPFEITHFKHGYLGIKPNFDNDKTYNSGILNQLHYHSKRFKVMFGNLSYFNSSIWDNLIGEYGRSIRKHEDYYYIFNFFKWDENQVNKIILNEYSFEKAKDADTTWRVGDGAAPFYNFIFFTLAGFTEFDTFRSNQIREGMITREEALKKIEAENEPRYQSIKWFLDVIDLDFQSTISRIDDFKYLKY